MKKYLLLLLLSFSMLAFSQRRGTCITVGTAPGYDVDAQAYITAHGSLSVPHQTAVNNLFTTLKTDGTYTKLRALWIPLWGNAADDKWNIINPLDTDAAFRLTFGGTVTHSIDGVNSDGSTGFIDTKFNANTESTVITNMSMGIYKPVADPLGSTRVFMGASDGTNYLWLGLVNGGNRESVVMAGNLQDYAPNQLNGTLTGMMIGNIGSGTRLLTYYQDGVAFTPSVIQDESAFPDYNIYLLASNGSGVVELEALTTKIKLAYVGDSLTPSEVALVSTAFTIFINAL